MLDNEQLKDFNELVNRQVAYYNRARGGARCEQDCRLRGISDALLTLGYLLVFRYDDKVNIIGFEIKRI